MIFGDDGRRHAGAVDEKELDRLGEIQNHRTGDVVELEEDCDRAMNHLVLRREREFKLVADIANRGWRGGARARA